MEKHSSDALYRQIAELYAKADGERLLRERAEIETDGVQRITPGLDRRVRDIPARAKRRRYTRIAGLVAAALLLVAVAPQLLRGNRWSDLSGAPMASSAEAPADEQATEEAAPEQEDAVADELQVAEAEPEAGEAESPAGAGEYEVIPLSFALPANLSVIGVEQDNAQSVYFLSDQLQDDVVMTLEYSEQGPVTDGLLEIEIDGVSTWGTATADYSLLTFESGGILYKLTCRHDINTLVDLGRSIL